jgi:hypothetical protein
MKMPSTRELAGLASNLGGYWGGQEEEVAKKAPKKNNSTTKKATEMKKEANAAATSYTMKEKTHKEAGFYGGDTIRVFVPQTELGEKVDKFLYWVFSEEEEGNMCQYVGTTDFGPQIDNAGKEDIDSFFVPLDQSYMASLSFFQLGGGTFGDSMANGLKNKEGSAVEQMKAFAKWYAKGEHYYGYRVEKLDWLIKKLEAKKVN